MRDLDEIGRDRLVASGSAALEQPDGGNDGFGRSKRLGEFLVDFGRVVVRKRDVDGGIEPLQALSSTFRIFIPTGHVITQKISS